MGFWVKLLADTMNTNHEKSILLENFFNLIQISGPEASTFLQGQLPCDLNWLKANTSTLTAYCNNQGRLISILRIYALDPCRLGENLSDLDLDLTNPVYLLRHPQELTALLLAEFQKYGQFSDIRIRALQPTKQTLQYLCGLSEEPWAESLSTWFEWQMKHLIPEIFNATSGQFLAHDLGLPQLEQAISFNKGCYRGQEIIARMHYRAQLKKHLMLVKFNNSDSSHTPGSQYKNELDSGIQGVLVNSTKHLGLLLVSKNLKQH